MYKINLSSVEVDEGIDWETLYKLSEGYSGADIANVCREASLMQMRRMIFNNPNKINVLELANSETFKKELTAPITEEDLLTAVKNTSKTVSNDDLARYVEWEKEFKSV